MNRFTLRVAAGLLWLVFALCPLAVLADEVRHYDWLTSGRVSGHHILTLRDDGTREVDFQYKDRGRGPSTLETLRFDEDGRLLAIDSEGKAYMGAPTFERFRRDGDQAHWETPLEQGATHAMGEAFYVAANGTLEQSALLARALLAAPGQSLPLLPSGTATLRRVAEARVGPEGAERDVFLVEIVGLDLQPSYLWLDEHNELFAMSAYWMGMVPQGWAAWLPELSELQKAAEARYQEELAARLTRRLPAAYVINNVHVVDVERGALWSNHYVVVRDGHIATLGHGAPEGFEGEVIDGRGGYVVPGLWDMHTHLGVEQGMQHIAGGVTTTRDLGNNPEDQHHAQAMFDAGTIIGPRVFMAGFIDRKSPYSAPIGRLADTLDDALAMVDDYAAMGYPQIKLYSSMEPGWIEQVAQVARGHGMRVSGHIPNGMKIRAAVSAGYNEVQHINMLFLEFLADSDVDTRTAQRITIVGDQAAGLDLASEEVTQLIGYLASEGVVVDPTLALFHGMLQHAPGEYDPSYAKVADHLPAAVQRNMRNSILVADAEQAAAQADDAEALVAMVGRLHESGVRLVAGTDATPGFLYHRELELYAQAGIPNADVLRIATLGAAEVMGVADQTGSIAPGKDADIVVLVDNPLDDISAVRRARWVIKGNQAWRPADLHRAMGIQPFVED